MLCSAMAYGLAVNGAKVAIIGRNKEKLAKMSETLTENAKNEYSKEATVKGYSCNVLDKEELVKTYEQIKAYVLEHTGLKVSHLYIAQVKQKYGIIERENYNKPKSEDARQPQCPPEKEKAITEALRHFGMI